jgi:activator of HSP90 ATPase
MALPLSTANWHWKNKNVTRWGQEWFKRELTTITIVGDSEPEVVSVSEVTTVEGDVELGQRKSKYVPVIFLCKLRIAIEG